MSIPFDPNCLYYAVVEHLETTKHLSDPVEFQPEHPGQYRLVCLALKVDEAERLAHLLQALGRGVYDYTLCLAASADPGELTGRSSEPEPAPEPTPVVTDTPH